MGIDGIALLEAAGGGIFMGTYPVPIKTESVLKANVSPIVFQCYKSFWVCVTGLFFLVPRLVSNDTPVYQFTWWAVIAAASWIPSGICTITSVSLIGVGMGIVINTATAAILSFLVFWLVVGEEVKEHDINGAHVYLAPMWLICIVFGMAGLVYAPQIEFDEDELTIEEQGLVNPMRTKPIERSFKWKVVGYCSAVFAGFFSACQYGCVTIGKKYVQKDHHCQDDIKDCPEWIQEAFNTRGSWCVTFGYSALIVTLIFYAVSVIFHKLTKDSHEPLPSFHFKIMAVPGTIAGLCWSVANFLNTIAVVRGGNAICFPQSLSIQLITSGLWGIFYYHEMGFKNALVWGFWAVFTIIFIILLGLEKGS